MNYIKKFVALIMALAVVFSFSGCLKYTSNILEVTRLNNNNFPQNNNIPVNSQIPQPTNMGANIIPTQNYPEVSQRIPEASQNIPVVSENNKEQPEAPKPSVNDSSETNSTDASVDPSVWTTREIVAFATAAINKTKGYKSPVKVNHKENLKCDVTKCPFEKVVRPIANKIIESVVKPTDEIMSFTNGQTVNSENQTVPLLLPKRGPFTLDVSGVSKATAQKSGPNTVIHIQLVEEMGTLTEHPKHNAASVGYLDAGDVDLGSVKLNYLNIKYTGTTLDITVNPSGYIVSILYKIPIDIDVEGKVAGLTAQVACEGVQSEDWIIKW